MSFSSLLEEANHTLDSDADQNDTQWSNDSSNSNTLPSPNSPLSIKQELHNFRPNVKQEVFVSKNMNMGFVPNPEYAGLYPSNLAKQYPSYDVQTEPNPYYQNGMVINQPYFQHQMFQQRTHLPIQYDEYYNINSLPKQDFILNNHNNQNLYQTAQKPLTTNVLPQNIKTEKNRKRSNKKAEPRKKIKIEYNGPPPNWKPVYEQLIEMRKNIIAPVDVMGCFKNAETDRGPKIYHYQVMISLMLSSQTKDEVTAGAMTRLKKFGLTPKKISETEESELAGIIHPVGFWQKKAGYIKNASRIVHTEYDDDIPKTVEGLTSLPGIGPKMAHLCMEFAWNKLTGISVDTHVHRICQRLGWTPPGLKHPDDTRKLLEHWLPKEEWGRINLMMVGFGQVVCLPTKPRCFECNNQTTCPYALENPDRTSKKTHNTTKPSARNQKFVKQEVKTEVKTEQPSVKIKQECETKPANANFAYQNPFNNRPPTVSPTLCRPPAPSPTIHRPPASSPTLHRLPASSPTLHHQPPASSPTLHHQPYLYPTTSYQPYTPYQQHYMKLELQPENLLSYHTLTPTASPTWHNQENGSPFPPGFIKLENGAVPGYSCSPMSCIQSPMIDTTTSPLINPLNTETAFKLTPEELKTENVLDTFLDW